jgi:succinate dehydrogenase / fumarate reductase, cytochrome b subunit
MSESLRRSGDSTNEPSLDQTGRFVRQPNGRPRPLSPHMQVWRWHVTMAASILFRITIGAATGALVIVIAWLGVLAFGPDAYDGLLGLAASPLGLLIGFGLTLVGFSFLLNGLRHLFNDTGNGLTPPSANTLSSLSVYGPVVLSVLFWAGLFLSGKVHL